jgi:hypothetical protein
MRALFEFIGRVALAFGLSVAIIAAEMWFKRAGHGDWSIFTGWILALVWLSIFPRLRPSWWGR